MQFSKQADWPTAPQVLTQMLCALAFTTFAAWSQPSHAGSLLLWSWLGVTDIQIMQSGCSATAKPAAAAIKLPVEKMAVVDSAKAKPQSAQASRSKESKAL